MSYRTTRRRFAPLLALPLLAACVPTGDDRAPVASSGSGAQATPASSTAASAPAAATTPAGPPPASAPTATASASTTAPAGTVTFQVRQNESKATFRVREQLANVQLPNDAVGTTGAVTGQISVLPEGAIAGEASKITVDLRQLQTDSAMRDNFIKQNTLQTSRFPMAEFVPTRAEGLPSPLPPAGEHAFRLTGIMTVRGVQKEVTWDVTARREGAQLTGRATTVVKFGDFGMTAPRVPVVLSIVDEIRLELDLVAAQVA
jgi:polyisoprenoid-binding protein YceI